MPSDLLTAELPQTASPHRSHQADIKIAYIGGGSRAWAMHLMEDLALSSTLRGCLDLFDIDLAAAQSNEVLAREIFGHPSAQNQFTVRAVKRLEDALKGAHFVVISIEPGPTKFRHADLEIPARHGILQTVGDTTGPGGILRALRCVPIYREFARAIMEHCPEAWVINYTNPMAVCTAALYREAPGIKAFGCCHEVFGTKRALAERIAGWFDTDAPPRDEIRLEIAGVNHFTWATSANWQGNDLMPYLSSTIADPEFFRSRKAESAEAVAKQSWFDSHSLVALDLLRRFGALGAAGDRHLVEFVPWYLGSEETLHRWGVVLTPYSWRLERSMSPRKTPESVSGRNLKPSGEEGVQQMEALLGFRQVTTNLNIPNRGQMPGYALGAIVETYAELSQNLIVPALAPALPEGAATWVHRAIAEQNLTLEAGFRQDPDLAFQALLSHPLVRISTDAAWSMFSEMLEATRPF